MNESSRVSDRFPGWLKKTVRENGEVLKLKRILREKKLHTVCQSAGCPNLTECFQKPTATFMILGNVCTRHCRYCGVAKGTPETVDSNEPKHIGETVKALGLKHVVITSVTRDDLPDGGAGQFAETVREIHCHAPKATVEVLVPDFRGNEKNLQIVLESKVDILNHNVETVPRLYRKIRPEADFERSLKVIKNAKKLFPDIVTKSGLMVGLGETYNEIIDVLHKLFESGCEAVTIGQYLKPSKNSYPVYEYVLPEIYGSYREEAEKIGFRWIYADPFVRSSFNAEELLSSGN